jgi:hypothetical protein
MGGNDYSFQIKNMKASESAAVSDSGKTTSVQKVFKDGRTKKCWTQYDISSSQEKTVIDQ